MADSLDAISANLGTITSGYISSVEIVSSTFQTATTGKRIEITSDGITLHISDVTGKYGTNFKYGDGTKYGAGVLAYVQHTTQAVPFYVQAEQTVGDFHYYNRSSNPSGAAEVGDVAFKSNKLIQCIGAGTPGTWENVGTGVGSMFANVFYPDKESTDQGATDATYTTVFDIMATIGATEKATIVFQHDGVANTTEYKWDTTDTITSNFTVIVEPGAIFTDTTGDESLTIAGPFSAQNERCFNWSGSGSITLSLIDRYNVIWYGADPTGTTTCEDEIMDAIAGAPTNTTIYFPTGVYKIDATITVSAKALHFMGEGRISSRIWTATDHAILTFDTTAAILANTEVSDIGFLNTNGSRTGSSIGIRVIGTKGFNYHNFHNLYFAGTYHGIRFGQDGLTSWGKIYGCVFTNSGANTHNTCISIQNNVSPAGIGQHEIFGNLFQGTYGLYIISIFGDSQIGNNNFDCTTTCILIDVSGASNSSFSIVNNECDVATQPIHITGAKNFMILGNSYLGPESPAVANEDHVLLTNCTQYTVDVYRNATAAVDGSTWMRGGMEAGEGAWICTKDEADKDERTAHFIARERTALTKMLSWGFDSDDDVGWIQCTDHGTDQLALHIQPSGAGVVVGTPTGGHKGDGTINATAVYDDNVILTGDYAIEAYVGEIDFERWDGLAKDKRERELRKKLNGGRKNYTPTEEEEKAMANELLSVKHEAAHKFDPKLNFNIDNYGKFFKENKHLPALPLVKEIMEKGNAVPLSGFIKQLWETVEVQAVHIDKLNQRLKYVEDGLHTMFHNNNGD